MIQFKHKYFSELSTTELYELLKLRASVFVVEQNCPYQDCDDKDKNSIHLLGYDNDQLVAYARLLPEGLSYPEYCSIGRVAIIAEKRNLRYGKLLMSEAIRLCIEKFPFPIKISAQAYLEKFYRDFGFSTVSDVYLEDDIPHIAMIRK